MWCAMRGYNDVYYTKSVRASWIEGINRDAPLKLCECPTIIDERSTVAGDSTVQTAAERDTLRMPQRIRN
jgi:hypothetical protein